MREVLEEIREYYQKNEKGWIKGRFEDGEGGYCLDGAIARTLNRGPWREWYPKYSECRSKLESLIDDSLISWNDKPERTREEVMALLDRAINE